MSALKDVADEIKEEYDRQISAMGQDPKAVAERGLVQNTRKVIQDISKDFQAYDKKNPEALFTACFRGLDKIEQNRFVLMNMLEKLKQHNGLPGQVVPNIGQVVQHFNNIGVTDIRPNNVPLPADLPPPSGIPSFWP